jgi:hypothetical protein
MKRRKLIIAEPIFMRHVVATAVSYAVHKNIYDPNLSKGGLFACKEYCGNCAP